MSLRFSDCSTTSGQVFWGQLFWGEVCPSAAAIEFSLTISFIRSRNADGPVAAPKLDVIGGIVNMPWRSRDLRRAAMSGTYWHAISEVIGRDAMSRWFRIFAAV